MCVGDGSKMIEVSCCSHRIVQELRDVGNLDQQTLMFLCTRDVALKES